MVRYIEGTIDYEKHNEVLSDNHKVLIYLDDMTLTGKYKTIKHQIHCFYLKLFSCRHRFTRWFLYS